MGNRYKIIPLLLTSLMLFQACDSAKRRTGARIDNYEKYRDSIFTDNGRTPPNPSNIFDDDTSFIPGVDSVTPLLNALDTMLNWEVSIMEKMDTVMTRLKYMESYSPEEKEKVIENINSIDSFFSKKKSEEKITCREKNCLLYMEIIKSKQMLFLYLERELKDSFPVSTGTKRYPTPDLNASPSGPLFAKYTSKKWPGGDYKGLGNMPYAVFIKGGYAIHGTTPGNYSKLGTVASHGCIRVHPDNARVIYELVKLIGLSETWVNVRDSL